MDRGGIRQGSNPFTAGAARTPLRTPSSALTPNDDQQERVERRKLRVANNVSKSLAGSLDTAANGGGYSGISVAKLHAIYDNIIKLTTENKITKDNAFSCDFIGYLPDIVKLERQHGQFNFQKASCGLDAGVKVFSKRVDCTHDLVFMTLQGLGATLRPSGEDEVEDEGEKSQSAEEERLHKAKKREEDGSGADPTKTLATEESIRTKTTKELSFEADPLFSQTSKAFDENGASGLLQYNLAVYANSTMLFDSKQEVVKQFATQQCNTISGAVFFPRKAVSSAQLLLHQSHTLPFTLSVRRLCCQVMPDISLDESDCVLQEALVQRSLYRGKAQHAEAPNMRVKNPTADYQDKVTNPCVQEPRAVPFSDDEEELVSGDNLGDNWFAASIGNDDAEGEEDDGAATDQGATAGWGVSGSTIDFSTLMEDHLGLSRQAELWLKGGIGSQHTSQASGWAGVGFWRYNLTAPTLGAKKSGIRSSRLKEEVYIDFENGDWQPPNSRLQLGSERETCVAARPPVNMLLPEDMHFQAVQLFKLSLAPQVGVMSAWQDVPHSGPNGMHRQNSSDARDAFFNGCDDDDDSDAYAGDWGEHGSGLMGDFAVSGGDLLQAPRRVENTNINYARVAKQVDVRVLKNVLWRSFQQHEHPSRKASQNTADQPSLTFQQVIDTSFKESSVPGLAIQDLSIHLCFICLLHLANENNLSLSTQGQLDTLVIGT